MAQIIEFIGNHWILSGLWVLIFIAIVGYHSLAGGTPLSSHQATLLLNHSDGVMVDIRDKKDFDAGHITNAVNLPLSKLKERHSELDKYRSRPIIIVCNMGQASSEAVSLLQKSGFENVHRLKGGITEWRSQGLPLVS